MKLFSSQPLLARQGAACLLAVSTPAVFMWLSCSTVSREPGDSQDPPRAESSAGPEACGGGYEDSTPSGQLELTRCLEEAGELAAALRVLADLEEAHSGDVELVRAASARLQSLLRRSVSISGVPARLRLADSPIPLPMIRGGIARTEGVFLWDSGAEGTALDRTLCSNLGLRTFADLSASNAAGEATSGYAVGILSDELVLGAARVSPPPVACLDLSSAREVDPSFLGILGGNVLRSRAYPMNLAGGWIDLGGTIPPSVVRMRSSFSGNRPYVWVELDGSPVRFLLDTGSVNSTISKSALEEMGVAATALGTASRSVVVGGTVEREAEVVSFERFRSGQVRRNQIQFAVEEDNLLGGDFLGERTLVVDHDANLVGFIDEP